MKPSQLPLSVHELRSLITLIERANEGVNERSYLPLGTKRDGTRIAERCVKLLHARGLGQ